MSDSLFVQEYRPRPWSILSGDFPSLINRKTVAGALGRLALSGGDSSFPWYSNVLTNGIEDVRSQSQWMACPSLAWTFLKIPTISLDPEKWRGFLRRLLTRRPHPMIPGPLLTAQSPRTHGNQCNFRVIPSSLLVATLSQSQSQTHRIRSWHPISIQCESPETRE